MDVRIDFDLISVGEGLIADAQKGAIEAMEYVRAESLKEVPRDTGALAYSSRLEITNSEFVLSFNTPYALRQHEGLWFAHPNGGKAKYLEDPFMRSTSAILDHIQRSVNTRL